MKDNWKTNVRKVVMVVYSTMRVRVNQSCGMHVHVSFITPDTLNELQRIANAVVYFEDALFELLLRFCYCSKVSIVTGLGQDAVVAACTNPLGVVNAMNCGQRNVAVNFTNLL